MYNENYYSRKIKDLQKKKRKAHNKSINVLYKKVGHYFVQSESKKSINAHNYNQFTYIDKNILNELRKVANFMPYEKGNWKLRVDNVNEFCNWFAKIFRDDQGKKPDNNTNHEQNNSPKYNSNIQANNASTNNSDDRNKDDDSSSQDSNIDELNFLNHYNNENH